MRLSLALVSFAAATLSAVPARAELVFFSSGRSLSITAHRLEGDSLVLTLRTGGEMVCEPAVVARFGPDEVPYPEPFAPVVPLAPIAAVPVSPYGAIIDRVSAEHGVDANLVRAVIQVESAYQERARSRKGAMGLMQLMPETARQYAVADPYDPTTNIEAGIRYLGSLLERLPVELALAAYNAGEAAVQRFHGIPPYPETRQYVARIMKLAGR
ncbi:MAG: lytic transglycosylase domain-containing protein [Acidobacteriia bacterium]|nr:lytic transglycosylase domain-containing protein [Terriglobia bacterium]